MTVPVRCPRNCAEWRLAFLTQTSGVAVFYNSRGIHTLTHPHYYEGGVETKMSNRRLMRHRFPVYRKQILPGVFYTKR